MTHRLRQIRRPDEKHIDAFDLEDVIDVANGSFVFELHDPAAGANGNGPLVAGGRYDELLSRLGAKQPIPAVGFAVWIERVANGGGNP